MKLNLDSTFNALNGKPVSDGDGDAKLGTICARALATPLERDKGDSKPESVMRRWHLAMRLQAGGEAELSPEEVTEVRARVAEVFALEVAGPVLDMLNG